MKKILSSFIAAVLISTALYIPNHSSAASSEVLSVQLDKRLLDLDAKAVMKNESPFVPVYMTKSWSGVRLHWNQETKTVTVTVDGQSYKIVHGSRTVKVGEKTIALDIAAYIDNGRVMIPASLLQQMTGIGVQFNEKYRSLTINSKGRSPIAVADNRPDVKIFGENIEGDVYKGLVLEIAGKRHHFDWETPLGWKEVPELIVSDLNEDGKSEVVVLLNQGSGTGIHAQDIHIISMSDFKEVSIEAHEDTIKNWVSTELKKDGDLLQASIVLHDKGDDVILRIPDMGFVDQSEIGFGGVVYHRVENNKLIARLGGAFYFSMYLGDLEITYAFEEGRYVADKLKFTPFDEYMPYVQKQN